jgi:MarR family transcriptional regulator, organic hydroperoxide resistance regulator
MKPTVGYELVAAVMATADAFLRESQRLFRPYGLTGAQYNLLNVVAEATEGLSQRELSDRLVVDRSNITGLIDRMETAGWVQRRDHPGDRRAYRVQLTSAGRALWREVTPLYLAAVEQVTEGVPARRQAELLSALRQLEQAAGAWKFSANVPAR